MEYEQLSKGYRYGLQKIYEMVINNDPCYAYLLRCNQLVDQKLVMAHVYGHNDFFKNNICFSQTNRKMMDEMANHGNRIRSLHGAVRRGRRRGLHRQCLSPRKPDRHPLAPSSSDATRPTATTSPPRARTTGRPYEVPEQGLHGRLHQPARDPQGGAAQEGERPPRTAKPDAFPEQPERDVLLFLLEHAPLKTWQHDVLAIIREEAYYFAPQGQTKIMNEGWASFWHSTIMTTEDPRPLRGGRLRRPPLRHHGHPARPAQPVQARASNCSATSRSAGTRGSSAPSGRSATTTRSSGEWDKQLGLGRQKIFEVRRIHNDVTFIDTFLTPDFCRRHKLFSFKHNDQNETYEIESREFKKIKERLLFGLTNFGQPIIRVKDGNYRNRGELYLQPGALRDRPEARPRPGHAASPSPPLDAPGSPRNDRRRAAYPVVF